MKDKKFNFFTFYENRMNEIEKSLDVPDDLAKELKAKRKFGYEKYGEHSFQSNFENAVTTPTEEHLKEEFIDAINYAIHCMYKRNLLLKGNLAQTDTAKKIIELYKEIKEVFPSL